MAKTHGTGFIDISQFRKIGCDVVIENGVLIFHPENIELGDGVYIGHHTILKGYYKGIMKIGHGTWVGQQCFFHSAGDIIIGKNIGIGPAVKIITSSHLEESREKPLLRSTLNFEPVIVEDDADIGIGAIILPGVTIGRGAQVGAGAVVTRSVSPYDVVVGVPARVIRTRS